MIRVTCAMAAIFCGFTSLVSTATVAQGQSAGLITARFEMPETDEFVAAGIPGLRSYVELDELRFTFRIGNESQVPIVIDQVKLREAVAVVVGGQVDAQVTVHWVDQIQRFGSYALIPTFEQERIIVDGDEFVAWTLMVRRTSGARFAYGDYVVLLTVADLRRAVSTLDGETWDGRLVEGTHERIVSIKAPQSPSEEVRRHVLVAASAQQRQDYDAAIEASSRAAAADPTAPGLIARLALLYLATGRYSEAVISLEAVVARGVAIDSLVTTALARAYVGAGDENNARRVLLTGGVPPAEIASELSRARAAVRELDEQRSLSR